MLLKAFFANWTFGGIRQSRHKTEVRGPKTEDGRRKTEGGISELEIRELEIRLSG